MPAGFVTARVYFVYDDSAWYAASDRPGTAPVRLDAQDREAAQTEADGLFGDLGLSRVSDWAYGGDDEAGSSAVYAEAGSGDALRTRLSSLRGAHLDLLDRLGLDADALPHDARVTLFSQDVILTGLVKTLVDKGVLTEDDLMAATGSVGAVDASWLTEL